jgi:lantibiotic modifying enzyme
MEECCEKSSRKGSLYCGGLGPHVYLRYQLSKITKSDNQRTELLQAAKAAAEYAYSCASQSSFRVSLLEGKQIGALCLLAAIDYQLEIPDTKHTVSHILSLLDASTSQLPPSECEVLYGRAGAIQAALWLRQEFRDASIGRELVVRLAIAILLEGQKQGDRTNSGLLSWEWHGKVYVGAAHGIVGILQTLLSLDPQDWNAIQRKIPTALQKIQETMHSLMNPDFCFESGNLKSSVPAKKLCADKLVHWCHGAPGLVLLWIQAANVFPNDKEMCFRNAKQVADNVLWRRGLLRKGVGLCHGISGNGMVLLRLAMIEEVTEERTKWRNRAFQYVQFAMEYLDQLKHIPDGPYSLFEGVGGLVCFLLQCAAFPRDDGTQSLTPFNGQESLLQFPLYEFQYQNRRTNERIAHCIRMPILRFE